MENESASGRFAFPTALPYDALSADSGRNRRFSTLRGGSVERDERLEFITWIASNPGAGDVITGSGGCRKVRWASSGRGKRGGARVIYFNAEDETIWLLIVYTKAKFDRLPTEFLAKLKQGVEDAL